MENSMSENCIKIEDLLARKSLGQIRSREESMLTEHLQACEQCRAYWDILMGIPTSMDASTETSLIPDARIYQHVKNEMGHAKPDQGELLRLLQPMLRVFKHRIPLYQAMLGIAVILIMSLVLERMGFSNLELSGRAQTRESAIIESKVLDHLEMIEKQNIGGTVSEGNLLVHHTVGVRDAFFTLGAP